MHFPSVPTSCVDAGVASSRESPASTPTPPVAAAPATPAAASTPVFRPGSPPFTGHYSNSARNSGGGSGRSSGGSLNFRSALIFKVQPETAKDEKLKDAIEKILIMKMIDVDKVCSLVTNHGVPSDLRCTIWKLRLGVLPPIRECWSYVASEQRTTYLDLLQTASLVIGTHTSIRGGAIIKMPQRQHIFAIVDGIEAPCDPSIADTRINSSAPSRCRSPATAAVTALPSRCQTPQSHNDLLTYSPLASKRSIAMPDIAPTLYPSDSLDDDSLSHRAGCLLTLTTFDRLLSIGVTPSIDMIVKHIEHDSIHLATIVCTLFQTSHQQAAKEVWNQHNNNNNHRMMNETSANTIDRHDGDNSYGFSTISSPTHTTSSTPCPDSSPLCRTPPPTVHALSILSDAFFCFKAILARPSRSPQQLTAEVVNLLRQHDAVLLEHLTHVTSPPTPTSSTMTPLSPLLTPRGGVGRGAPTRVLESTFLLTDLLHTWFTSLFTCLQFDMSVSSALAIESQRQLFDMILFWTPPAVVNTTITPTSTLNHASNHTSTTTSPIGAAMTYIAYALIQMMRHKLAQQTQKENLPKVAQIFLSDRLSVTTLLKQTRSVIQTYAGANVAAGATHARPATPHTPPNTNTTNTNTTQHHAQHTPMTHDMNGHGDSRR